MLATMRCSTSLHSSSTSASASSSSTKLQPPVAGAKLPAQHPRTHFHHRQQYRPLAAAAAATSTTAGTISVSTSTLEADCVSSAPSPPTSSLPPPSTSTPASTFTPTPTTSLTRLSPVTRACAVAATSGLLSFVIFDHELPAARLAVLTYLVWALGEWCVHKYCMHARSGSLGDRLTHLNKLHVDHHIDTHKDMTMRPGFSLDALYFHFPNTCIQILAGTAILSTLDATLSLDIPFAWTAVAATACALLHNLLWNTLHLDMHGVVTKTPLADGIPVAPALARAPRLRSYVQWVFNNHTTHHDTGGTTNFNIVCPGPDLVFNTYMSRSKDVVL